MGSIAKKGLQQYLLQLKHHPLRTKAITAGVLSAISDTVAQKLSGIPKLQLKRLLLKVLFGFAYLGPFGHFWHIFLDKLFKGKKDTKTVAKKVVLEQLTSSPWNNLLFMVYYGLIVEAYEHAASRLGVKIHHYQLHCLQCEKCRKTLDPCEKQNKEGLPGSAVYSMDVLAGSWVDKSPIRASAIPCNLPERYCMLLGNISESTSKVYGVDQKLI